MNHGEKNEEVAGRKRRNTVRGIIIESGRRKIIEENFQIKEKISENEKR